jgi:AcrR family transcriptional regulator
VRRKECVLVPDRIDQLQNAGDPGEQHGLRERKKQRTRAAISQAALDLFTENGFDRVTVAQIARRAEVSEATVFNYFRTKEDLVYDQLEDFWALLVGAVEQRAGGVSALATFRAFMLSQRTPAQTPREHERLATISRMIIDSPALLARERETYDRGALTLAVAIAGSRVPDIEDRVCAHALLGVHKMLVEFTREQVLAGVQGGLLARRIRALVRRACATLEAGLRH